MVLSIELQMLLFTAILGIVQLLLATQAATAQRGVKWNLGMREGPVPPLTGLAGRLDRAFHNLMETFPFFIAAIVAVQFTGRGGGLSAVGAIAYFTGRVLHFGLYAAAVTGARTAAWLVSMLGLAAVILAALGIF